MKKYLFAFACFISMAVHAQTADQIVQKYTAAMGGLDAFNKVTSAKMTGIVIAQGMELPLTTQLINNKACRTDVEVMGAQIINVYNNGTGWKINPYQGAETATDLTAQEMMDTKAQASLANQLMDYKNRGHRIEAAGQEAVEGVNCYKIKLLNSVDNKTTTYYINTADNMLLKSVSTRELQGAEKEIETFYSDVKEFNGLKFVMHRAQKMDGEIFQEVKMDKIELNVGIDEAIFKKQ